MASGRETEEKWTIEVSLSKPLEIFESGQDDDDRAKRALITSQSEQNLMADLIYQLLCYEPEKRLSA